ncbi:MAG: hypothetical protein GQ570_08635, partial [Helicobacteraceae bacterium]|nr:hypothetical protein [Helicobacteraceae bacterium]
AIETNVETIETNVISYDATYQAYVVTTNDNAVLTSADAVQTALDRVATNADVVTTNADVVITTEKADIAQQVLDMTATASTLIAGSPASASYNPTTGIMTIGVPVGATGEKGDPFIVNAQGLIADRGVYDTQPTGFSYFATDESLIYFKNSATSGDWSLGADFGKGDTGDTGNGIASITLTGSVAEVDTYRILYTDATFFDFTVTNGSVTSVSGRTGDIVLTSADVGLGNVANESKATMFTNPSFTGILKEEVTAGTLTLGANSSIQTYTATADFTIVDDLISGESVEYHLTNGGFTPTYPTITWVSVGQAEPTLNTTDILEFKKVGAILYGKHTGIIA